MTKASKIEKRSRRRLRVRSKVAGDPQKPRLSVFRSNRHLFVQLIDDNKGSTLISVSDSAVIDPKKPETKKNASFLVGEELAKKALAKKIKKVVFDKGGYKYHGRVKAIAEGARKGGLEF